MLRILPKRKVSCHHGRKCRSSGKLPSSLTVTIFKIVTTHNSYILQVSTNALTNCFILTAVIDDQTACHELIVWRCAAELEERATPAGVVGSGRCLAGRRRGCGVRTARPGIASSCRRCLLSARRSGDVAGVARRQLTRRCRQTLRLSIAGILAQGRGCSGEHRQKQAEHRATPPKAHGATRAVHHDHGRSPARVPPSSGDSSVRPIGQGGRMASAPEEPSALIV